MTSFLINLQIKIFCKVVVLKTERPGTSENRMERVSTTRIDLETTPDNTTKFKR